ncbi:MAG: hypothetical protein OES84_06610, partial [Kiritimatiellaceae bacterium]|nr:hypothetical protein [Kiritimatiellaceae bacterium]
MKRMMSIAVIALLVAGSSAFACDSCGCKAKKAEKKAECTSCTKDKKCGKKCDKKVGAEKADEKKAEAAKKA